MRMHIVGKSTSSQRKKKGNAIRVKPVTGWPSETILITGDVPVLILSNKFFHRLAFLTFSFQSNNFTIHTF